MRKDNVQKDDNYDQFEISRLKDEIQRRSKYERSKVKVAIELINNNKKNFSGSRRERGHCILTLLIKKFKSNNIKDFMSIHISSCEIDNYLDKRRKRYNLRSTHEERILGDIAKESERDKSYSFLGMEPNGNDVAGKMDSLASTFKGIIDSKGVVRNGFIENQHLYTETELSNRKKELERSFLEYLKK